jgi:hypothetical protein
MIVACCFVGAAVFTALGIWLCILGDSPTTKIGDHSYMKLAGVSINGIEVPRWAFYFAPVGVFVIAIALWFIGWRKSLVSGRENP